MKSFLKDKVGKVVTEYGTRVMDIIKTGSHGKSLFKFWGDIKVFGLRFTTNSTPSSTKPGSMSWNIDEDTLDIHQKGATLQVGQEIHYHVRNNTASTISDGEAVMATGTLGNSGRITIAPMNFDGTVYPHFFLGVATGDILAGEDGKVTHFGKVRKINTSAYSDGDVLWGDPTTPGGLTATKPEAPNLKIACAFVIKAHSNGTIFVRANAGIDLHNNHRVEVETLSDGDVLTWDATDGRWENARPQSEGHVHVISDLTDVDTTTPAPSVEEVLMWDGVNWANTAMVANNLSDVDITTPADGQILKYNSTSGDWENADNKAEGVIGPTDGDVSIISDGNVTIELDNDDDETFQKLSVKDGDNNELFYVNESGTVGVKNIIQGGTDENLTISSDGDMTFVIDKDNDENQKKFSFVDNATEVGSLDDKGNFQIDGLVTGKQREVYSQNFLDDIATTIHYLPFKDINEQTTIYQEEAAMLMPCDGKVVSVSVRMSSVTGSGNLTIGVNSMRVGSSQFTAGNWVTEETETLAVTSTDDYHLFHFAFSNGNHFSATDLLSISIQASADLTGTTYFYVSTVIEYDWNRFLGATSGEYDATP